MLTLVLSDYSFLDDQALTFWIVLTSPGPMNLTTAVKVGDLYLLLNLLNVFDLPCLPLDDCRHELSDRGHDFVTLSEYTGDHGYHYGLLYDLDGCFSDHF